VLPVLGHRGHMRAVDVFRAAVRCKSSCGAGVNERWGLDDLTVMCIWLCCTHVHALPTDESCQGASELYAPVLRLVNKDSNNLLSTAWFAVFV